MSFDVAADDYDRFMGRYSRLLSPLMADLAAVRAGQQVLDVGCGPGVLTAELVARTGPANVVAVDPSTSFVAPARERAPGVEVLEASAEALPFASDRFDAALAQLVVHFMADPLLGVAEMARVTRPRGMVAACVWDHAGGAGPLSLFWEAARRLDPAARGESEMAGARQGDLRRIFVAAGLRDVEETSLAVTLEHADFDAWWAPFNAGVGPAGAYVAGLGPDQREELRETCQRMLGTGPFAISARAWAARGRPA